MLNKKYKKNTNNIVIDVKYKYETINDYASGDVDMLSSLELIKGILEEEKCKEKNLFKNEKALNLDKVEYNKTKQKSNRDKTYDFVVGLNNNQLMLVEAKFDANNMDNVASDVKNKIKHSEDLLKSNTNFISIFNKKIILLNKKNIEQNKRKLKNKLNNDPSYSPLDVKDFYEIYFK